MMCDSIAIPLTRSYETQKLLPEPDTSSTLFAYSWTSEFGYSMVEMIPKRRWYCINECGKCTENMRIDLNLRIILLLCAGTKATDRHAGGKFSTKCRTTIFTLLAIVNCCGHTQFFTEKSLSIEFRKLTPFLQTYSLRSYRQFSKLRGLISGCFATASTAPITSITQSNLLVLLTNLRFYWYNLSCYTSCVPSTPSTTPIAMLQLVHLHPPPIH